MDCWKCAGTGFLAKYAHIEDGVCFACGGDGEIDAKDKKAYNDRYFRSGTKRGGTASHLVKVDHTILTPEELKIYRNALRIRAIDKGLKVKAGFHTAKLKKELQEKLGLDERGMKIVKKGDGEKGKKEKSNLETMKESGLNPRTGRPLGEPAVPGSTMYKLHESDPAIIQEDENGKAYPLFTDKDGNYFNQDLLPIKNPFTKGESLDAQINNFKPIGKTIIPIRGELREISRRFMRNNMEREGMDFLRVFEKVLDNIETKHAGLLANVALENFGIYMGKDSALGTYGFQYSRSQGYANMELRLNFFNLVKAVEKGEHDDLQEAGRRMYRTVVHELAHAYHHQVILQRGHADFAYGTTDSTTNPLGQKILDAYEEKMKRLESIGIPRSKAVIAYTGTSGLSHEQIMLISKVFTNIYGASSFKEYFATLSELMVSKTGRALLKERHPKDYEILKEAYQDIYEEGTFE